MVCSSGVRTFILIARRALETSLQLLLERGRLLLRHQLVWQELGAEPQPETSGSDGSQSNKLHLTDHSGRDTRRAIKMRSRARSRRGPLTLLVSAPGVQSQGSRPCA